MTASQLLNQESTDQNIYMIGETECEMFIGGLFVTAIINDTCIDIYSAIDENENDYSIDFDMLPEWAKSQLSDKQNDIHAETQSYSQCVEDFGQIYTV